MTTRRREVKTGRKGKATPDLPVITLLTDFGAADYFVGAVKGVILSVNPKVILVDITHEIPPQDILAAAFTLFASYNSFPVGTIHLAVVDPGVGSARRPVVLSAGQQLFVGPDNGLFSYIYAAEADARVFHVTNEKYFRQPVSTTFNGRDIFGPVAAALSLGVKPGEFGPEIFHLVQLPSLAAADDGSNELSARIVHIDRFGNCITNLTREHLPLEMEGTAALQIKAKTIKTFRDHYSEGNKSDRQLFGVWGSAGFLEISLRNGSAAAVLKAKTGDVVRLTRKNRRRR